MKVASLLGLFAVVAGLPAVSAPNQSATVATFTGRCTKVMPKNVVIDPAACSDTVTKLELPDGQTGFTFMLSKLGDSKAALMSFFGTGSTMSSVIKAIECFQSIECTSPPMVVHDLAAVGSCIFAMPSRKTPAKVSCSANTIEGDFAAEFIGNGAAPSHEPDLIIASLLIRRYTRQSPRQHSLAASSQLDSNIRCANCRCQFYCRTTLQTMADADHSASEFIARRRRSSRANFLQFLNGYVDWEISGRHRAPSVVWRF